MLSQTHITHAALVKVALTQGGGSWTDSIKSVWDSAKEVASPFMETAGQEWEKLVDPDTAKPTEAPVAQPAPQATTQPVADRKSG